MKNLLPHWHVPVILLALASNQVLAKTSMFQEEFRKVSTMEQSTRDRKRWKLVLIGR